MTSSWLRSAASAAAAACVTGDCTVARRVDFVHEVLDAASVGIVSCDAEGRVTLTNRSARTLLGVDDLAALPRWGAGHALRDGDGAPLPASRTPLFRALAEGQVEALEVVLAVPGRPVRVLRCDGRVLREAGDVVTGAVVALTDVTAERAVEAALRETHSSLTEYSAALARSEARFRAAFESGPTAMCRLDHDGVVLDCNPALRRLLARPSARVLGHRLTSLVVPADREHLVVALAAAGSPDLQVDVVEVRLLRPDGTAVWCEVAASTADDDSLLVQLADVDARKRREDELERRASRDELTGLPNRAALLRALGERLAPGVRTPPPRLLFLDLDGFKAVNDTSGHAVGDEVLQEVARRLCDAVRPGDLVARLGGDEFVVVLAAADGPPDGVEDLIARVHEALRGPVRTTAGARVIGASVGVARAALGDDPVAVLARADAAMYATKASRRGSPSALRRRPGRNPVLQPRIAELLATAEEEDRLQVVLQPVVELATGRVVGAEALLRMRSRTGALVPPDAFVPVAEATGDIHALGEWVLRTACARVAGWKRALPPDAELALGVNLSPRQLDDPALLSRLDTVLEESGLEPSALVLEITERLLTADTDDVRRALQGVRDRGVHLACDDFGSGYASLRYLDELPVDLIKIDRSWTARLPHDGPRSRLARGVLRLATTTGLVVVAEGIETEPERAALQVEGCVLGQGYLFSQPVPPEQLDAVLLGPAPLLPVQRPATADALR